MKSISYNSTVESVVNAKPALRESTRQPLPELARLEKTAAFKHCDKFLNEYSEDVDNGRVISLMFTLAALAGTDPYSQRESLCLLGVRGVDAYERERGERRRMAALARQRPIRDVDWYVKRHLPRAIARIAGELRALVEHPEMLEGALKCNGKIALMKHVC